MRRVLFILLLFFVSVTGAQAHYFEIYESGLVKLTGNDLTHMRPAFGLSGVYEYNRLWAGSIDADISAGTGPSKALIDHGYIGYGQRLNLNEVFGFKQEIQAMFGIGLGHEFTYRQTDHNFHIYSIGFKYRVPVVEHIKFVVSPQFCWRSYSAHLAPSKDMSWVKLSIGFSF